MSHLSSNPPFNNTSIGGFQTNLSPHHARAIKTRDNPVIRSK